eukprot:scaffold37559_cov49-Prasinocladus_malaysianus.AAC.2
MPALERSSMPDRAILNPLKLRIGAARDLLRRVKFGDRDCSTCSRLRRMRREVRLRASAVRMSSATMAATKKQHATMLANAAAVMYISQAWLIAPRLAS